MVRCDPDGRLLQYIGIVAGYQESFFLREFFERAIAHPLTRSLSHFLLCARTGAIVSKPCVGRDELHESLTFPAILERLGTRVTRPSGVLRQSRSNTPYLQSQP